MSIIVFSYQHCDVIVIVISNTLMCNFTHLFSVTKLDLIIQALAVTVTIGYILAMAKKYAYASRVSCFNIEINIFEHF